MDVIDYPVEPRFVRRRDDSGKVEEWALSKDTRFSRCLAQWAFCAPPPGCPQAAAVCAWGSKAGAGLWGSSLSGTSLLTSTAGGAFLTHRAVVQTPVGPLPGNGRELHACPSSGTLTCMVHAMVIFCTQAYSCTCVLHVSVSCMHIHYTMSM